MNAQTQIDLTLDAAEWACRRARRALKPENRSNRRELREAHAKLRWERRNLDRVLEVEEL